MLLPAALIRLTLSIDLRAILRLGPKLLAMYLGASLSIMLGAMVAFWVMRWLHPATVSGDTWAGMAALARSWIDGGANMLAMREVFDVDATTFGQFAVVDVGVGYVWMAVLIFLAGRARNIDARSGADTRALDALQERMARFRAEHARIPSLADLTVIVAVAFGGVGLAHALANPLAAWCKAQLSWPSQFSLDTPFVWVVVLAASLGLLLSFTRARTLEGAGASKIGTLLFLRLRILRVHHRIHAVQIQPMLEHHARHQTLAERRRLRLRLFDPMAGRVGHAPFERNAVFLQMGEDLVIVRNGFGDIGQGGVAESDGVVLQRR